MTEVKASDISEDFLVDTGGALLRAPEVAHAVSEKYQVELPAWSGPYDVLLQVIEDQELNLLDLDISILLDKYLEFIQDARAIDLEEAGEFVVVGATLAQIKSKLLLPKEEAIEEDSEKDPREDLVKYLQEYQKIKQAAELLRDRPLLGRDVFIKGHRELFEGIEGDGKGTLFQLVRGFQKAIREFKATVPMSFQREEISVSHRLREIFEALIERREISFSEIFHAASTKIYIIASFLAVLELVRLKRVKLAPSSSDSEVYLSIAEVLEPLALENLASEFEIEKEEVQIHAHE